MFVKKIKAMLFFWTKKKIEKTFAEKLAEALPVIIQHLPEIRKLMRTKSNDEIAEQELTGFNSDGGRIGRMYDFARNFDGSFDVGQNPWGMTVGGIPYNPTAPQAELPASTSGDKPKKIEAKPKDIVNEVEVPPTPINVQDLDEKIALLKDKSKLVNQRYVNEELKGVIKKLENRKHYAKYAGFYEQFPVTTSEKIDKMLEKYDLVFKTDELFIPSFPKEAIDVMKAFDDTTREMSGEGANFYVIAENKDFKDKYKKNDPILLAQSPFGFFWYILGAWDKELILLSEL